MFYTWVYNFTFIESFFNKILNVKHGVGSPISLCDEQMATRPSVCSALLKRFRSKDDFHLRLVTVDETWVHYCEPENKAQLVGWLVVLGLTAL